MKYISTRGNQEKKRAAQAIIAGLAPDKGLYVPELLPKLSLDLERLVGAAYHETAHIILSAFLDDFTDEELSHCTLGAYDGKFDTPLIAPLTHTKYASFLELYHGRTAAFKDMALSILPYLLTTALRKENEDNKIIILTATSGDTGKAALEGFADVPGTEIFVFYPKDGVSEIQERQMITQRGANTHVFAIEGNFDDAQTAVKQVFNDTAFAETLLADGCKLSSANSINIGRLVPQVAYYVHAYLHMLGDKCVRPGEPVNIVVPTGNFGNILAAYYAKCIGLPVHRLICASNENNVLTDFINTGVYDANRRFHLTSSPSMDILISSNLERLLWHLSDGNSQEIAGYMHDLETTGCYTARDGVKNALREFHSGYAQMDAVHAAIATLRNEEQYLIDTHTAVAYRVYLDYRKESGDDTPTIIASTASAYKFADRVAQTLGLPEEEDGFAYIDAIHRATGVPVPDGLKNLKARPITQHGVVRPDQLKETIESAIVPSR